MSTNLFEQDKVLNRVASNSEINPILNVVMSIGGFVKSISWD